MKINRTMILGGFGALIAGASITLANPAPAAADPMMDQLCMVPAFVNAVHGTGLAGRASECAYASHPSSYGSGPDDDNDGVPNAKDPDDNDPNIP